MFSASPRVVVPASDYGSRVSFCLVYSACVCVFAYVHAFVSVRFYFCVKIDCSLKMLL